MVDECQEFSDRRSRCHDIYGENGEECVHEQLKEKRCVSMKRCSREAIKYYGKDDIINGVDNSSNIINKAICASWAESFAYANKGMEHGDDVARHHQVARNTVVNDPKLRQECRQIAFDLAQCLLGTEKRNWWY